MPLGKESIVSRFKIISEKKEYQSPTPHDKPTYVNVNSEKNIPKKDILDIKKVILLKRPRPENTDPVKKLDENQQELINKRKKYKNIYNNNRQQYM